MCFANKHTPSTARRTPRSRFLLNHSPRHHDREHRCLSEVVWYTIALAETTAGRQEKAQSGTFNFCLAPYLLNVVRAKRFSSDEKAIIPDQAIPLRGEKHGVKSSTILCLSQREVKTLDDVSNPTYLGNMQMLQTPRCHQASFAAAQRQKQATLLQHQLALHVSTGSTICIYLCASPGGAIVSQGLEESFSVLSRCIFLWRTFNRGRKWHVGGPQRRCGESDKAYHWRHAFEKLQLSCQE